MTTKRHLPNVIFMIALALALLSTVGLVDPVGMRPAHAGQVFIPYDDFNKAALDSGRWQNQELVREVREGKLFFRNTRTASGGNSDIGFVNPGSINSFSADVTVTAIQSMDTRTRALLQGKFYQTGAYGGSGDYTNVVFADVAIQQWTGGLVVRWFIDRCTDFNCNNSTNLAAGIIKPVVVGQTVNLSIGYDAGVNQFTFAADGTTVTQVSSAPRIGAPNVQWKGLGTRVSGTFTGIRSIDATFDNVKVNGAPSPYDDFSLGSIDSSKWIERELVREADEGVLSSVLTASGAAQSNSLTFSDQNGVTGIKADVTVTQATGAGNPRARLTGYFYKSSSAPVGDYTGEVQGEIDLRWNGANLVAYWFVAKCTDSACNTSTDLQTGTFGTVALPSTHTLSIVWDGTIFTFGMDGAAPQTFDPRTAAPIVSPIPPEPWKIIGTRVSPGVGAVGSIHATFDNVHIQLNPATGAVAPALICGRIYAAESPTTGLANAGVVATAVSGGSGTFTTLTGPDGSYCIGVPFPGAQYILSVFEPGRQTTYYVSASEAGIDSYAATPFAVVSGAVTTRDMLLPVGASFSGKVTTNGGATPIPGATVIFHRWNANTFMPTDTTMTDVNGNYSFVGLPPGLYSASARMTGYAVGCYGGAGDLGVADWFTLATSESRANVNMDLAVPAGTISGQITAAVGGAPISNATVYARGMYPRGSYVRSTATDTSGNYTLPGLAPGRYMVEVRPTTASGYATRYYAAALGRDVADPVDVTAGATRANINVALPANPGAISGVVHDQAGDPVSTVCVGAELITGGWTRSACANGDGSYLIDRLPPGVYRVRAETEGAHLVQHYNNQLTSAAADDVTVTAGNTRSGIDFTLKGHPGQIRGITRADNGQPIAGATINARTAANSWMYSGTSSSTGAYTIRNLPPGYYKVRVAHPDFAVRFYSQTGGADDLDDGSYVAVTADTDTSPVNVALSPVFGRIIGKVTEQDGVTPIVGASVNVRHTATQRTVFGDTSGANGTYEITSLPPGTYTVRAGVRGRAVQHYNGQVTHEAGTPVVLSPGGLATDINFALSPLVGSLSGRVTGADGTTPMENATVDVLDAFTGGLVSSGTVNATGDYRVLDLPPGTYKVRAVNAWGYADWCYLAGQPGVPSLENASTVTVTNGNNTGGINIRLMQTLADVNHDNKPDLLWVNSRTGELFAWLMSGSNQVGGQLVGALRDTTWRVAGIGDLNGDGKADLVWVNRATGQVYAWYMDGATQLGGQLLGTLADTSWQLAGVGDVNGDGHPDLVWYHRRTGQVYAWLLDGATQTGGASLGTLSDTTWRLVGLGDVNLDGKPDLVWYHRLTGQVYAWLLNGTVQTGGTLLGTVGDTTWTLAAVQDLNADGKPDLLWRHRPTGALYAWFMNGTTQTGGASLGTLADLAWQLPGEDEAGKADLVWRNTSTGEVYVWFMNGTTQTGGQSLGSVSTTWQIAAVGDLNLDGKPDLLWRNTSTGEVYVWFMNGTTQTGGQALGTVGTTWQLAAMGDLNLDGKPVIVWRDTSTGEVYVWFMNGTTSTGGRSLGDVPTTWQLAAVGDLNLDGKPDVVWRNTSTGEVYVWFMNGTTQIGGQTLGTVSTTWQLAAMGDLNLDGKPDLVWRNTGTGEVYVWFMNGTANTGGTSLGTVSTTWRLVGAADLGE